MVDGRARGGRSRRRSQAGRNGRITTPQSPLDGFEGFFDGVPDVVRDELIIFQFSERGRQQRCALLEGQCGPGRPRGLRRRLVGPRRIAHLDAAGAVHPPARDQHVFRDGCFGIALVRHMAFPLIAAGARVAAERFDRKI